MALHISTHHIADWGCTPTLHMIAVFETKTQTDIRLPTMILKQKTTTKSVKFLNNNKCQMMSSLVLVKSNNDGA